jgi:hypothetical protein
MSIHNVFVRLVGMVGLVVLSVLGGLGQSARGEVVTYTDRTDWINAISAPLVTDHFDNLIASQDTITLDSGIVSTAIPRVDDYNGVVINYAGSRVYSGRVGTAGQPAPVSIDWVFPEAITAFGGDFDFLNPDGLTVTGDFDGNGWQTISVASVVGGNTKGFNSGFFGIVSTGTFDSITWSTNDDSEWFFIDNFSFDGTVIPEPSTLATLSGLISMGLIGAWWKRRRKGL